jgi:uncharacterized protein YndB with AHSA1/START domain
MTDTAKRTVTTHEATHTVSVGRAYDTTIEDLWDACTNLERIPRWFLPIDGELRAGGHFQLKGNAGGTIERCDPPRSFRATWEYGGKTSWIEVTLTAQADTRTWLELAHIAPDDPEHWEQYGPGAVGVGWDLALLGLGRHLDTGEPQDPGRAMTWAGSEDGRRFIAASSDGWCEASVAGGADPANARAAADRTTAFYCP